MLFRSAVKLEDGVVAEYENILAQVSTRSVLSGEYSNPFFLMNVDFPKRVVLERTNVQHLRGFRHLQHDILHFLAVIMFKRRPSGLLPFTAPRHSSFERTKN